MLGEISMKELMERLDRLPELLDSAPLLMNRGGLVQTLSDFNSQDRSLT